MTVDEFGRIEVNGVDEFGRIVSDSISEFGRIFPTGVITIYPSSIASLEAFGTSKLNQRIFASAISSLESFGTPKLNLRVIVSSIASGEAFGTAKINQRIKTVAITSAEAFGNVKINQRIKAVAVASAESFGTLIVIGGRIIRFGTSLPRSIPKFTRIIDMFSRADIQKGKRDNMPVSKIEIDRQSNVSRGNTQTSRRDNTSQGVR